MTGSTEDQLENFLKSLPSYESYKKFDEETTDTTYINECKALGTTNEKIKNLCVKFVKNLKALSDITSDSDKENTTFYLFYWIYYEIWKLFGSSEYKDGIRFSDLLYVGNKFYHNLKSSVFLHYYDPNFTEWAEMKYLHDYFFKNFENIDKCRTTSSDDCEKYKEYLTHIKDIYANNYRDCCVLFRGCKRYFKCEKRYDPKYLLSRLESRTSESPNNTIEGSSLTADIKEANIESYNSNDDSDIRYFSCKEIKDESNTPFLSCYIVKQAVKVPKEDEQITGGKRDNSAPLSSTAMKNVLNMECDEVRSDGKVVAYNCKPTSTSPSFSKIAHVNVKEEQESSEGHHIIDGRKSSLANVNTSLRWKIDEKALNCNEKDHDSIKYKLCEHIKGLISKGIIEKPPIKTVSKLDVIAHEPAEDSGEEYEEEYIEEEHLEHVSNLEVSESAENGKSLREEDSGKESDTKIDGIPVTCRETDTEICTNFKKAIASIKKREKSEPKVSVLKKRKKLTQETVTVSSTSETRESLLPNTVNDTSEPLEETPGILNNSIFRVILVAALIFGGIIVLFIYFKYTPLGSFIHKKIRRKKEFENDILGEQDQMVSLYDSEYLHENSHKKRIHLSYHHTGEDY
ncbi:PIR Superfamily Protein [Plasmodium ovale wallikeri]|uniref:PIR protein n=2 Tax=Plasmodium ovale TaxID=36330 RepID=A0A1C3KFA9_PLAOA|nr:PIR Superfamily Protein [Plasmodium ovale wallikeri]SBT72326.1 PIR protein [Plasmodium ovale]